MHNDRQLIDGAAPNSRGSLNHAWGYWGLALLMATLYSILSLITPLYLDDWSYMGNWRDDLGNKGLSISALVENALYVRGYDNGRIPNMIAPLESMFSPFKDLFPILTGVLLSLSIVIVQRFAGRLQSVFELSVTWVAFVLFLPWKDTLFENIYAFNYIWAAAITLFFLWFLRKGEKRGWTPSIVILSIILAILAGGWHESMAAATLCGLGLLILVRKFRFSNRFYIIVTVYFVSAVFFMLSPGMLNRMANSIGNATHILSYRHFVVIFAPAILIILNLFSVRGREILMSALKSDIVIVGIGIVIAGTAIGVGAANVPRSFYWPNMAAICVSLYLILKWKSGLSKSFKYVVAGVLVVMCSLQVGAAIYWQGRYTRDWEAVMSGFETSETGTVFYDSPNPPHAPRYTLGIPYAEAWRSPWHLSLFQSYVMTPTVGVVPTALRDAGLGEATPLRHAPGTPPVSLYKGYLISPYERLDTTSAFISPAFRDVKATMPDGVETSGTYVAVPFITERGDTLTYYTPW